MIFNRILITGASGFLGSEITRQIASAGFSVIATDRNVSSRFKDNGIIASDILDPLSLSKVTEGVDCVCHVAGLAHVFDSSRLAQDSFYNINVVGAENVARAAMHAGVKHFIFISSVSVYGGEAHGKDESSECHPQGPYAESKWLAERRLTDLCRKAGMNLTILRLATLYGEGDPGNVARLIKTIDRGRFIWVGTGVNLKSLLHRADASRACVAVIKHPVSGINIYNVSAPPCTMCDVVTEISHALGKQVPAWHISSSFALASVKIIKGIFFHHAKITAIHDTVRKWLADDYYSMDKFNKTFNFEAQISLGEGIPREVEWYKKTL